MKHDVRDSGGKYTPAPKVGNQPVPPHRIPPRLRPLVERRQGK